MGGFYGGPSQSSNSNNNLGNNNINSRDQDISNSYLLVLLTTGNKLLDGRLLSNW